MAFLKMLATVKPRSHSKTFTLEAYMAKLDVFMLKTKVRSLKQREQDLKRKLKMYQDGITVNNDVLKDRNPLFVINDYWYW